MGVCRNEVQVLATAFHFSGDYEPVVQSQMTSQHVPGAFLFIDTARYKASNIIMNIARVPPLVKHKDEIYIWIQPEFHPCMQRCSTWILARVPPLVKHKDEIYIWIQPEFHAPLQRCSTWILARVPPLVYQCNSMFWVTTQRSRAAVTQQTAISTLWIKTTIFKPARKLLSITTWGYYVGIFPHCQHWPNGSRNWHSGMLTTLELTIWKIIYKVHCKNNWWA